MQGTMKFNTEGRSSKRVSVKVNTPVSPISRNVGLQEQQLASLQSPIFICSSKPPASPLPE